MKMRTYLNRKNSEKMIKKTTIISTDYSSTRCIAEAYPAKSKITDEFDT